MSHQASLHRLLQQFGMLLLVLLACAAGPQAVQATQATWVDQGPDGQPRVHLYFFWSASCPHCQEARPFVEAIPQNRPWVELHSLEVSRHRENAIRFAELSAAVGQQPQGVPTLILCGQMEVGWQDAASSGARLLAALDACRRGELAPAGAAAPPPLTLPLFGALAPEQLSLPLFTLILAGLDAFNPCAFFVLLFLLSLLAHQQSRRRMLLIGGVFVATSGLMYFAFMAAWLNLFQLLGSLGGITLGAGLLAILVGLINLKDVLAPGQGPSLSIPASAKPGIYRRARAILQSTSPLAMLGATVFLAVTANFYELLCTAGFPMVYTRVLTLQETSATARLAWLALYNLIYVLPLLLIVLTFVTTLSAHKLTEREGRLLKLMSGTLMLALGLLLTFAPALLNSLAVSAVLLALALLVGFLAPKLNPKLSRRPPD